MQEVDALRGLQRRLEDRDPPLRRQFGEPRVDRIAVIVDQRSIGKGIDRRDAAIRIQIAELRGLGEAHAARIPARTTGKLIEQKQTYLQLISEAKQDKLDLEQNYEKFAREKFIMSRPDEDVFIIESRQVKQ